MRCGVLRIFEGFIKLKVLPGLHFRVIFGEDNAIICCSEMIWKLSESGLKDELIRFYIEQPAEST